MQNKVGIFCCVDNLYKNINKAYERKLDYAKYLDYIYSNILESGDQIIKLTAYIGVTKKFDNFAKCLSRYGYDVKYHKKINKFNWNVGLVVDISKAINLYDTVILGSSSIQFLPMIEWLKNSGIKVILFSCKINHHLRNIADECFEISRDLLIKETINHEIIETT